MTTDYKSLHVYLDPDVHRILYDTAANLGVTVTALAEAILRDQLDTTLSSRLADDARAIMTNRARRRWES